MTKTRIGLAAILVFYSLFTWWFIAGINEAGKSISASQASLATPMANPVAIVRFPEVKNGLVIPTWTWLNVDKRWMYVSKNRSIDQKWQPELSDIDASRASWIEGKRIQPEASSALDRLFDGAKISGYPLVIVSAYRSAQEQQELYDNTMKEQGSIYAESYIAKPGQSEHQTGLAVDISSYTTGCTIDFSGCQLQPSAASWLEANAPDYGFILRYPPGKLAITNVAHEPWHFRYVGIYMAKYIQSSGLTYDEVIQRLESERK